jgi:nucleotide-binding universal stress UspA family protein
MGAINIKRILFATDFLESSRIALDYAVALAHHFEAGIVMVHAIDLSDPAREAELTMHAPCMSRKEATGRLDAFAAGVRRTGLTVETFVEDGVPYEVVLDAVQRHNIDLLVLGVHGIHRGLKHLLIGSNTETILLAATCPTLTVGPHVMSGIDLTLHLEEVLYLSDFTPEAAAAAPYALFFGHSFGVPVDVCQLLPVIAENNPRLRDEIAEDYCATMKRVLNSEESDWCLSAYQLDRSIAIDQIIDRAKKQTAGIIVLGAQIESHLGRHLHTSFAYQLLAKATCPVLTISGQWGGRLVSPENH